MSGSTIGGVVGGVIGFYVGGPTGAQYGFMIGSAVGGAVDPEKIQGPKLTDPQRQTSNEGVPRPIVYGTAAVMGNVIQCQSEPTEHKHTEGGKGGGPVQETFTYTRTVAIRICEAAPLGGTMMLRRAWVNGKLAYDASGSGAIDPDSAKFLAGMTFYSGSETQLPNADLEALPAGDGGGVGNVPAYRGTCYAVLRDVDVTQGQGALPVFRWEVASCGSQTVTDGETFLVTGDGASASDPFAAYALDPSGWTQIPFATMDTRFGVPAYDTGTWVIAARAESSHATDASGTWTTGTTPNKGSVVSRHKSNGAGTLIAVGTASADPLIMRSTDSGASYQQLTGWSLGTYNIEGLAYGGRWVVLYGDNAAAYSEDDGDTWNSWSIPAGTSYDAYSLEYGGSVFAAGFRTGSVDGASAIYTRGPDDLSWTLKQATTATVGGMQYDSSTRTWVAILHDGSVMVSAQTHSRTQT